METIKKKEEIPAYPPEDYKGSQADWMVELEIRGYELGQHITQKEWWEILESCEG